ncbi:hypothetical protein [Xenorhabdus beddingii]|uniref:hypothetical protein n=1 Tax=Xenorhabdus beddingii TaxID=40578 RepID=UPI000A329112|nr:hypothetical protein [Xenorhabdus beddingii]
MAPNQPMPVYQIFREGFTLLFCKHDLQPIFCLTQSLLRENMPISRFPDETRDKIIHINHDYQIFYYLFPLLL